MFGLTSIRARLHFYFGCCFALIIAITATAAIQLRTIDEITEDLDHKWLTGTRVLGEMADLLSELRLDQARLALASDKLDTDRVLASADAHLNEIAEQRAIYDALPKTAEEEALWRTFIDRLNADIAGHQAWAALPDDRRRSLSPAFQVRAHELYRSADDAVDALIEANQQGADKAAGRTDLIVDRSTAIAAISSVLTVLLAGLVLLLVRRSISRPLAAMTSALTALASGRRDIPVPESHRRDEIGELAKAFDVFRANALALEEAHKKAEAAQLRAQELARHDVLTGLPNRRALAEELDKAFARARRNSTVFAVLMIDLDRFKPINDIHGHPGGDAVLYEIASRLKATVRKNDTVARIGGDEFAIVCELQPEKGSHGDELMHFADRVLAAVREPISLNASEVEVGASIGIALCPADGDDAETILHAADIAMYRAKDSGRDMFRFYEQSMEEELRARVALEAEVRRAVAADHIVPYYQPLIHLADGQLVGFEILARWNHPEDGPIFPDVFVPVIEHLGLMGDFTLRLLRRACLDAKAWPPDLRLSLNVSPPQLKDPVFPARLLAVLSETGFPPPRLEIEITETALMTELELVKTVLAALHDLGIKVALDDFGTGYSSLYHLRELKLDKIKIDRSFIHSMNENPESTKIVNAILGLASSLGLPATAEGIEESAVLEALNKAGCEIGQGYLFAEALPAAKALAWMHGRALATSTERKIA